MSEADAEKRQKVLRIFRERRGNLPTRPLPAKVSNSTNDLNLPGGGRLLESLQGRFADGPAGGRKPGRGLLLRALAQNSPAAVRQAGGGLLLRALAQNSPAAGRQAGGGLLLRALAQNAGGATRGALRRRLGQSLSTDHGAIESTEGMKPRAFAAPANLRSVFGPADLRTAAREAWIFCVPLIEAARVRTLAGIRDQRSGTGINSFSHNRELATPAERLITAPNVDTLFSVAFIDLENGPATVVLPSTGERYISLQLMDMYTNSFAVLSTRTIGCDGGTFTVVGPRDAAPDGAVRSPTGWVWALVRIAVTDPNELAEINQIQNNIVLRASPARTPGGFARRHSPWQEYFSSASALLEENPPPATDQAALGCMAPLGLGPGHVFDPTAFDAAQLADIEAGVADARSVIANRPKQTIEGWAYAGADSGNWGQNYVDRARAAVGGLAALPRQEAMYMHAVAPDGNHYLMEGNWRLRFSADQLPPVYAFWSLTAYEMTPRGQYFLAANPLNRYSI